VTPARGKLETAYTTIRERILDGTYGAGSRLVIDGLAGELGMSQVPVREAIRRLEAEGWIVFRRNVGAQVARFDGAAWQNTMQILGGLEGFACGLAAPFVTPAHLDAAREANDDMRRAHDAHRGEEVMRLNREVHRRLYFDACPNPPLVGLVEQTWDRLVGMRRSLSYYLGERTLEALAEHEHLIGLVEGGAPAEAVEAFMRRHKQHTLDAFVRMYGDAPPARAPAPR
jgi:DNA-binding GntR family transcriptional regulator